MKTDKPFISAYADFIVFKHDAPKDEASRYRYGIPIDRYVLSGTRSQRQKLLCTWHYIHRRCNEWPSYLAKGLNVEFETFKEFVAEIGFPPHATCEIDRIDNSKGYAPGNVRWVLARYNRSRQVLDPIDDVEQYLAYVDAMFHNPYRYITAQLIQAEHNSLTNYFKEMMMKPTGPKFKVIVSGNDAPNLHLILTLMKRVAGHTDADIMCDAFPRKLQPNKISVIHNTCDESKSQAMAELLVECYNQAGYEVEVV